MKLAFTQQRLQPRRYCSAAVLVLPEVPACSSASRTRTPSLHQLPEIARLPHPGATLCLANLPSDPVEEAVPLSCILDMRRQKLGKASGPAQDLTRSTLQS